MSGPEDLIRKQLSDSLYPTLAAAVGVGFVLAGPGSTQLGKALLRLAGAGIAGSTLRMIAATLAKVDPERAKAALDLEDQLEDPIDVQAVMSELSVLRPGKQSKPRKHSNGSHRRGQASRRH